MSDDVIKRLPEWFVHRLRAWANFRIDSGYGVPSSWPSDGPMETNRPYGPRYFRLLGSVHDTHVEIDRLAVRYRQAVQQFWILEGQGLSIREHARRRQVTHPTFAVWLRKGHVHLAVAFRRIRDTKKAQADQARLARLDRPDLPIYHSAP